MPIYKCYRTTRKQIKMQNTKTEDRYAKRKVLQIDVLCQTLTDVFYMTSSITNDSPKCRFQRAEDLLEDRRAEDHQTIVSH